VAHFHSPSEVSIFSHKDLRTALNQAFATYLAESGLITDVGNLKFPLLKLFICGWYFWRHIRRVSEKNIHSYYWL